MLALLLGIVAFLTLLTPFVSTSYGLDGRFHLYWIEQFIHFNSEGVFFPRWIPGSFWGFGSVAFYFYPPITYYFASLIHFLSGITSPMTLFQIISFIASVGSFFSMHLLLKSIGSSGMQRMIGSTLYMIAPVRYVELYHRGDLSTHVSYILIPIVWYALLCIFRKNALSRAGRIGLLGISATILALTSVPVAMVTGVSMVAACIAVWNFLHWDIVLDIVLAALLAGVLSAFHFSATLSAMPFTWLDMPNYHPPYTWLSLVWPINWFGVYEVLLVYIPVGLIFLAYWMLRHSPLSEAEQLVRRAGFGIFLLILFLDFPPLSRNLWNAFIPLQIIAFPWRLYSQFLLGMCIVVGIARSKLLQRAAIACTGVLVLGAILPALLAVSNQHVFAHFTRPLEDALEYRPLYTGWRSDFLRTDPKHETDASAITNFSASEHIDPVPSRPNQSEFQVVLLAPRLVTFHQFYWPFWHLSANGREIPSHPDSIGRAVATLPGGHYTLIWQLERTQLESAGLWISGFAWSGLFIFGGIGLVRRSVKKKITTQRDHN
jgi:hypothetical protein